MIIVGAKGFAKQVAEVFFQTGNTQSLYFFDNVSGDADELFSYRVLKNFDEVLAVFTDDKRYCLGIGGPQLRKKLAAQFRQYGGELHSAISPLAVIGKHSLLGEGVSVLTGAVIENSAQLQEGALINVHASVHHDTWIGAYAEIAPGARILGGCVVEDGAFVGANAVLLPKIKVGKNAVVGAGAVVTKDVEPSSVVFGNPAKHIRYKV